MSKWVSVVFSIDPCSVEVFDPAADAAAGDYPSTDGRHFTCSFCASAAIKRTLDVLMWALVKYQNCFNLLILFKYKRFYVLWK